MCNAYFIFAALVFLVMAWDRWGRVVREYNENDAFFEKWSKCCGILQAGECNKDYNSSEINDQRRIDDICIKYKQILETRTPETLLMVYELQQKNLESL